MATKPNNDNSLYVKLGFLGLLVVGLTLPFHYIPSQLMMFPKEQLTFSNTFITKQDVVQLIERYNSAENIFEQLSISRDPLFRKLAENGLIKDRNSEESLSEEAEYSESDNLDNTEENITQASGAIGNRLTIEELNPNVRMAFLAWEQHLINNSIFDYVTAVDCPHYDKMMALYEKENKYPMHADWFTVIPCDLNSDGQDDYLVNYGLVNCVGGNGWSKDFVFFLSTSGSAYIAESEIAHDMKTKFLNFSQSKVAVDANVYKENGYIYAKGLSINEMQGNKIIGTFALNGNGPKGTFSYDLTTKKFMATTTDK